MNQILHKVVIETTPAKLYQAISTQAGLSAWWAPCKTSGKLDSDAKFMFGPQGEHVVTMQITALEADKKLSWKCTDGPWANTEAFHFDIDTVERGAVVTFANTGWPDQSGHFAHCNSKWAVFLLSLKQYLETGKGTPHPGEANI